MFNSETPIRALWFLQGMSSRFGTPDRHQNSSGNSLNPFFYQIAGVSNSGNVLSGSSGYTLDNNVQHVNAIALDGSGNIWLDTLAASPNS